MSDHVYVQTLDLICGGLLLSAVLMLWRRELAALVRLLAVQGVLLAALAALLGVREDNNELYLVAIGVLVLKAVVLPTVSRDTGDARDGEPLVNVAASLLAAALLILLAYAISRPLVALAPSPTTQALPVGDARPVRHRAAEPSVAEAPRPAPALAAGLVPDAFGRRAAAFVWIA